MIELLQNLLKIKSISPNDMGCFDLIEKELKELGFNCERINYLNVENLYATFGEKGKIFCFLGHTDVVPTGPKDKWSHPPFSGHIEGDLLYGRGTADMKASIAAFLENNCSRESKKAAIEAFMSAVPLPYNKSPSM
jgi:succinyl-diaminopimelate desuccinylase